MEKIAYLNKSIFAGSMHSIKKIETKSGKAMCVFAVRVYEKQGEKDNVTFFNCSAYSGLAEIILKYGYDKRPCLVEAKFDTYKDSDGQERFSFKVSDIKLLGDKVA
jgi:single-stranded DNA-binding protein